MPAPELNTTEKAARSQPAESGKITRTIPDSQSRVEYSNGSFWFRSSPQDWKVAGITTKRARQLLGEDAFNSLTKELAEKNLQLPGRAQELLTGVQQTLRGILSGRK